MREGGEEREGKRGREGGEERERGRSEKRRVRVREGERKE